MYYMQRESTGKGSQPRLGPSTEPLLPGAPNDNFRKISVRKTIWDRNICCKISCLPASPRILEHLTNGIIAYF